MKSNNKETGIAVIGAGGIGNLRAHSCKQITQVDYIAVCDIKDEKLEKIKSEVIAMDIDSMSPRDALDALYKLKKNIEE